MIDNNIIIKEAETYLGSNGSIESVAKTLGISKRTLQLHIKKLEQIDKNLYNLVMKKKEENQRQGRIKGGEIGKATSKYTKEDAERIAKKMINLSLSYKQAEEYFKIPKSTIYEILHSDLLSQETRDLLDILTEANIHKITAEELVSRNKKW